MKPPSVVKLPLKAGSVESRPVCIVESATLAVVVTVTAVLVATGQVDIRMGR